MSSSPDIASNTDAFEKQDTFLNHYTTVIHAKNLLMNLKKNYNIKEAFLDFCRRAERDQLHERDIESFKFVVNTFFCWHMSSQVFQYRDTILDIWRNDYAASQEAYKAFNHTAYKNWYDRTYDAKIDIFNRAYFNYLHEQNKSFPSK